VGRRSVAAHHGESTVERTPVRNLVSGAVRWPLMMALLALLLELSLTWRGPLPQLV
jgi:hypothetical protein